jgi:hypothetical protein
LAVAVFSVPPDFVAVIADRLRESDAPPATRYAALALAGVIASDLSPQSFACRSSVAELADRLGMAREEFEAAARVLSQIGALTVARHNRVRRLALVMPGGPRRGPRRHYPGAEVVLGAQLFRARRATV